MAAQVPAHKVWVTVVAVLIPVSRATKTIKVIMLVIINNLVMGLSSSSSLVIKVIQSS